jgi:outer membrane protein
MLAAAPARADTLRDALLQAYESNPTLLAARANLRATDENVPIQRAAGLPSVDANSRLTEFLIQDQSSFLAPERALNAGLNLAVPLYNGGAVRNSVRAAEQRIEAGRAELRGTESALFTQVVAAYMNVLRDEAVVGLAQNQVNVLDINLQATRDRFEIGILTRTDVAQSEARLALARGDLQSAQSNLIGSRENYISLVGDAPDDLAPPPPLVGLPASAPAAVATALENNPDLLAARERVDAANFDIRVAGAGRLPQVSVITGYTYQNVLGTLGGANGVAVPQASDGLQAGLNLSLPLFQGGRPAAQQRQAQARASAAQEQVVEVERAIIAQARSAFASYRAAQEIIQSSETAVSAAALSLEGVRAENTVGNRTILDILDAERELLNARVQLVQAQRNAYVAGFSLLAAVGRAEARDLGLGDGGPLYDPAVNADRVRGKIFDWSRDPNPQTQATRTVDVPAADAAVRPVPPLDDGAREVNEVGARPENGL